MITFSRRCFSISDRISRTAAAFLSDRCHSSLAIFSCRASASGAEVIIATPDPNVGLFAQTERAQRQHLPVGLAKQLEARMRQRVRHDADLDADRLVLHQRDEMLGLRPRQCAALAPDLLRQAEPADQAVAQEMLHLDRRDQIDDAGLAPAVSVLALAQHRGELVDLIERALAARQPVGNALPQDVAERLSKASEASR